MDAFMHCSHDYFLEIKPIKNPWTNTRFTFANICNIYIAFNESIYKTPLFLQGYIENMGNLNTFMRIYEPMIRDNCIHSYIKQLNRYKCSREIRKMLRDDEIIPNYIINTFTIDESFPWENMNNDFKHCLVSYHLAKFSLNPYAKYNSKMLLTKKLCMFFTDNPLYGRKFINVTSKNTKTNETYVFGSNQISKYNTIVKTPFHKMTIKELNDNYAKMRRQGLFNRRVTPISDRDRDIHDSDSDSDSDLEVAVN